MVFGDNHELIRSHFQTEVQKYRAFQPNWPATLRARLISQQDYDFIVTLEGAESKEERSIVLGAYKEKTFYAFLHLLAQITSDDYTRYLLIKIDDLFTEDPECVQIFESTAQVLKRPIYSFFIGLLYRPDAFTVHAACIVITKMAMLCKSKLAGDDSDQFMNFLCEQMNRGTANDYIATTARCMQTLFRYDPYRIEFTNHKGFESIIHALYATRKCGFQIQYQLVYCMWLLTFNHKSAEATVNCNLVQTIVSYLGIRYKEKVIRITLATLRNILENIDDGVMRKQAALQMVQCKLMKKLEATESRSFDDVDIKADVDFLKGELEKVVQVLTSFDEYEKELRQGVLHWSPVHKCEKFWLENYQKLNENRCELLKMLINLLENSKDPLVICVAAYDIGEYVRVYPRGKPLVEKLGGKEALMRLLCAKDPNVRYHALLSAQKLMVHNWKFLGLEECTKLPVY